MYKNIITLILSFLMTNLSLFADTGVGESTSGYLTSLPPEAPILNTPTNEMPDVPVAVVVDWFTLLHVATYTLQISTSVDFNDLYVNESGLTDTTYSVTGLDNSTTYYWRVKGSNVAGAGEFSPLWNFTTATPLAVDQENCTLPESYALLPVYPNPFNPSVNITYQLPESADVSVTVFNSMGQSVRELTLGRHQAGNYTVQWDGRDSRGATVTSGLYLCFLKSGSHSFKQKMMLMR